MSEAAPIADEQSVAQALDRFTTLLRAAAPDMDPLVRADVICAAIEYGTARAFVAIDSVSAKLDRIYRGEAA